MLTRESLVAIMPRASGVADQVVPALDAAMARFSIDTPARTAAFLAQLAHESGELRRWTENLGYRWQRLREVFPKYFKTDADAKAFDRQPERIANRVYGGRMGNGPEASGDGWRYRGRGPIQLTGKDNYRACAADIGIDLVDQPERLETPEAGCLAAGWFWNRKGLNALADAGEFEAITLRINGGLNGQEEREAFWERAKAVLGVAVAPAGRAARGRREAAGTSARSPAPASVGAKRKPTRKKRAAPGKGRNTARVKARKGAASRRPARPKAGRTRRAGGRRRRRSA